MLAMGLTDPNAFVRKAAKSAYWRFVGDLWGEKLATAIPVLRKALSGNDTDIWWGAALRLRDCELTDANARERMRLALAGGRVKSLAPLDEAEFALLIEFLRCDYSPVASCAAKALGELGEARAFAPLVGALQSSARADASVVGSLAELGDARAIGPLSEHALGDGQPNEETIDALWKLGGAEAVVPVLDRQYVAGWAVRALKQHGWQPQNVEQRLVFGMVEGDLTSLISDGNLTTPDLVRALNASDWRARRQAAKALGERGDRSVTGPLIAILERDIPEVRTATAEALGRLGGAEALGALKSQLVTSDFSVETSDVGLQREAEENARVNRAVARALLEPANLAELDLELLSKLDQIPDCSITCIVQGSEGHSFMFNSQVVAVAGIGPEKFQGPFVGMIDIRQRARQEIALRAAAGS